MVKQKEGNTIVHKSNFFLKENSRFLGVKKIVARVVFIVAAVVSWLPNQH